MMGMALTFMVLACLMWVGRAVARNAKRIFSGWVEDEEYILAPPPNHPVYRRPFPPTFEEFVAGKRGGYSGLTGEDIDDLLDDEEDLEEDVDKCEGHLNLDGKHLDCDLPYGHRNVPGAPIGSTSIWDHPFTGNDGEPCMYGKEDGLTIHRCGFQKQRHAS